MRVSESKVWKRIRHVILAILLFVPLMTYGSRLIPQCEIVLWPSDLTYTVINGIREPIGRGPVVLKDGTIHWFGTQFIENDTEFKSALYDAPSALHVGCGSYSNFHHDSDPNLNQYYWRNEYNKRLGTFALLCLIYPAWLVCVRVLRRLSNVQALHRLKPDNDPYACRQCGYDLTGNVSGICSECGTMAHVPDYPSDDDF